MPRAQDGIAFDPYRALQIDPSAEDVVVHAAYRALVRRFRPGGETPDAHLLLILDRAYAVLRDPGQRRLHDELRRASRLAAIPIVDPATSPLEPAREGADGCRHADHAAVPILDFGRYSGWRLCDLARRDPDYLRWLSRHSSGIRYREVIAALLPGEPDLARRSHLVS